MTEYPDITAVGDLARLLVTFYLTLAIMGIGCATMFAGSSGASAAARCFFQRPVQFIAEKLMVLATLIVSSIWATVTGAVALLSRMGRGELRELGHDLRWLMQRFNR